MLPPVNLQKHCAAYNALLEHCSRHDSIARHHLPPQLEHAYLVGKLKLQAHRGIRVTEKCVTLGRTLNHRRGADKRDSKASLSCRRTLHCDPVRTFSPCRDRSRHRASCIVPSSFHFASSTHLPLGRALHEQASVSWRVATNPCVSGAHCKVKFVCHAESTICAVTEPCE